MNKRKTILLLILCGWLIRLDVAAQADPASDTIGYPELPWLMQADQERPPEELEQERMRMEEWRKKPIDINRCTQNDLEETGLVSPALAAALIRHRTTLGDFVDLYELQAIPGMDALVFHRIKPMLTIRSNPWNQQLGNKLKNSLEIRIGGALQKYGDDWQWSREKNWLGGPWQHSFRYWCNVGKQIKLAFHGEKDAGEKFQFTRKIRGYDFWGGGLQLNDWKGIKNLVIGDYMLQWGQGLIQWQGRAPGRQTDVTAIKAQGGSLRLQRTNAELGFHRGLAMNWSRRNMFYEGFVSFKKLDARVEESGDSTIAFDWIAGLQESGLHRTSNELNQKRSVGLLTTGFRACWRKPLFHVAFQTLVDRFDRKWTDSAMPYLRFRLPAQSSICASLDYATTYRNVHVFGETAWKVGGDVAFVHGLIWTVSSSISCSMLQRHLPNRFNNLHGQPFSSSSFRQSESGWYTGIQFKVNVRTQIQAYADVYSFSWLQYRIQGLTTGRACGASIINVRRKGLTWSIMGNYLEGYMPGTTAGKPGIVAPDLFSRRRIQGQARWPLSETLQMHLSTAWQMIRSIENPDSKSQGWLVNLEAGWKKANRPFGFQAQWIWANTSDYDARLYTQSWTLGGVKSFIPYYGLGAQWSIGLSYRSKHGINVLLRSLSRSYYPDEQSKTGVEDVAFRRWMIYGSIAYNW
jgi:hypothetical protein